MGTFWAWTLENSTSIKDLGILLFGGIGAFFTYRAWRQKRDEIKEKYFERRYELYITVYASVRKGLEPRDTSEWFQPLLHAADRAAFLIGSDAKICIRTIHDLLIEHLNKTENDDVAVRLSSKEERQKISDELRKFHSLMEPYLLIT